MPDLGRRLRDLRRRRNLSLYDVERLTGMHFSTIGKYERNERRPSIEVLRELAAVYEVPLGEMVSEPQEVANYLPESLRRGAEILARRADLERLVGVAEGLKEEQVERLADFLASIAEDPGASSKGTAPGPRG